MNARTELVEQLSNLPRGEIVERLESLLIDEVKVTLELLPADVVSPGASFIDELGLSSLRLMEIRGRLEQKLGCEISSNSIFNRPTVGDFALYLVELLGFGAGDGGGSGDGGETGEERPFADQEKTRTIVSGILDEMYRS